MYALHTLSTKILMNKLFYSQIFSSFFIYHLTIKCNCSYSQLLNVFMQHPSYVCHYNKHQSEFRIVRLKITRVSMFV